MGSKIVIATGMIAIATMAAFSCSKKSDSPAVATERYLYISSGECNSGQGITSFSSTNSSRVVSKVGLSSKASSIVFDLNAAYTGGFLNQETSAQSIIDNGSSILMLTENATSSGVGDRKIWQIPKVSPYNTSFYAQDTQAFTSAAGDITRNFVKDADDTILFSKSTAIEKIGTNVVRIPQSGPAPWVSAPAGACAAATTFITAVAVMPPFPGTGSGKIIFAHQGAAAAANLIGIFSRNGAPAASAAACLNAHTILSSSPMTLDTGLAAGTAKTIDPAGASPTAMVYIPTPSGPTTGKLLVALAPAAAALDNSTNLNNGIVMFDVTETSDTVATISNAAKVLYESGSVAFGISAMAFDSTDNSLYVATASQPGVANQTTQAYGYKVEKFSVNLANAGVSPILTLIRDTSVVPSRPFIERNSLTKCITGLAVGN